MKSLSQFKGQLGEFAAADFYETKGMEIIARNWRYSNKGELDIIACDYKNDLLVICEVKTRKNNDYLRPADAVDFKKQNRIKRLAKAFIYINKKYSNFNIRFDIIEVFADKYIKSLNCIENAF